MSNTINPTTPVATTLDAATAPTFVATSATHPARTAARKDRRLDHPAPLTAADRAALAQMPYLPDDGDLDQIPPRYRSRALAFLREFAYGLRTMEAMTKAEIASWELSYARRYSQTFRLAHDALIEAKRATIVAKTEDVMALMAAGEYRQKEGYLNPDTRAAAIILPAFDQRYKANAPTSCNQVQIHIEI